MYVVSGNIFYILLVHSISAGRIEFCNLHMKHLGWVIQTSVTQSRDAITTVESLITHTPRLRPQGKIGLIQNRIDHMSVTFL